MTKLGVGIQDGTNGVMGGTLEFEVQMGRLVDATRHYRGFYDFINGAPVSESIAVGGRSPLIAWHAFNKLNNGTDARWADITAGLHDDVIRQRAGELISLGEAPIRFVFHHEPEDDIDGGGIGVGQGRCGTPSEFAPAWRHVRRTMRAAGVGSNVRFGVCLMGSTYRSGSAAVWIPPTLKPDFIASDGYNHGGIGGGAWRSFVEVFSPAYTFAVSRGKPFVIEECGTVEGTAGQKATWFADASATLQVWKPELFMYSNVTATKDFGDLDYHIDTSPESFAAFKDLVANL